MFRRVSSSERMPNCRSAARRRNPVRARIFSMPASTVLGLPISAVPLSESGTALIGSPKTVLAGIEKMRARTGFRLLAALLQFGILSDELTRRNMDLFAAEVMPHLRD